MDELAVQLKDIAERMKRAEKAAKYRPARLRHQRLNRISMSMSVEEARELDAYLTSCRRGGNLPSWSVMNTHAKIYKYLRNKEKLSVKAVLHESKPERVKGQDACADVVRDG